MREWLSGGAPPCQGGGRGFDPRLALTLTLIRLIIQADYFLICLTTVSDISYYINSHTSSHLAYNYIHLHSYQTETIYNSSL